MAFQVHPPTYAHCCSAMSPVCESRSSDSAVGLYDNPEPLWVGGQRGRAVKLNSLSPRLCLLPCLCLNVHDMTSHLTYTHTPMSSLCNYTSWFRLSPRVIHRLFEMLLISDFSIHSQFFANRK